MPQDNPLHWTDPGKEGSTIGVRVLREVDVFAVYQPIVSLTGKRTFAHEALTRCHVERYRSPAALFEQAAQEQACGWLGRLVRNVIFENSGPIPLFVNLHPQELSKRWLVQPTDPIFLHEAQVFLEITESATLDYFDLCASMLSEVCTRAGAKLVVDDFGVGHSNMDRVLALSPQFVKVDMSLIRGIDESPAQQRAVANLVKHCHELNAEVVAEGIETLAELQAVIDLGVEYGQGYLLGKPQEVSMHGVWPIP